MITENGQPGKAENFAHLDRCCQRVSETFGKPEWDKWTNGDYIRLSQILFKETRVQISPNTLKRLFGKIKTDSRYYPQKATRDALARYIGHPDWDHFVHVLEWTRRVGENKSDALLVLPEPVVAVLPSLPDKRPVRPKWTLPILSGVVLLSILLFFWLNRSADAREFPRLICRNPVGENPHSAVFVLHRPNPAADEAGTYTIYFGDGRQESINPADSVYTHYYERPGRYFAVLRHNGRNVDTATVYLQTRGWTATANMVHDTTRVYPIEVQTLFSKGRHSVSAREVARAGVDTNRTFFVEFINSHETDIDGDNFELTAFVKTSHDRAGVRCSQVGITVWGESSQHLFDIMKPGCVHWIDLQTSELFKSGHRDDLSFLGADLRTGGRLKLEVINKNVHIFINNKKVYETRYTVPLNRVYGVRIQFAGIGTVDSFSMKDRKTGKVFDGNF